MGLDVSGAGLGWAMLGLLPMALFGLTASRLLRLGLMAAPQVRRAGMGAAVLASAVVVAASLLLRDWFLLLFVVWNAMTFEHFRLARFCPSCGRLMDSAAWRREPLHCVRCGTRLVDAAAFATARGPSAADAPR